ncbi:hypothetical protein RI367_008008 [Sorochytrium milnesiophthora]
MSLAFTAQETGLYGGVRYIGDNVWLPGTQSVREQGIFLRPVDPPRCDYRAATAPVATPYFSHDKRRLQDCIGHLVKQHPDVNVPDGLLRELLVESHNVEADASRVYPHGDLVVALPPLLRPGPAGGRACFCVVHAGGLNGDRLSFTAFEQSADATTGPRLDHLCTQELWQGVSRIAHVSLGKVVQTDHDLCCLVAVQGLTTVHVFRMSVSHRRVINQERIAPRCSLEVAIERPRMIRSAVCDPFGLHQVLLCTDDGLCECVAFDGWSQEATALCIAEKDDTTSILQALWGPAPHLVFLASVRAVHLYDLQRHTTTLLAALDERILGATVVSPMRRTNLLVTTTHQHILLDCTSPQQLLWSVQHHQPYDDAVRVQPFALQPLDQEDEAALSTILLASTSPARRQCVVFQCRQHRQQPPHPCIFFQSAPPFQLDCRLTRPTHGAIGLLGPSFADIRRQADLPPDLFTFPLGMAVFPLKHGVRQYITMVTLQSCGSIYTQTFRAEEGCGSFVRQLDMDYSLDGQQQQQQAPVTGDGMHEHQSKRHALDAPPLVDFDAKTPCAMYNMHDILQYVLKPLEEQLRGQDMSAQATVAFNEQRINDFLTSSWESRTLFELSTFLRRVRCDTDDGLDLQYVQKLEDAHREQFQLLPTTTQSASLTGLQRGLTQLADASLRAGTTPATNRVAAYCRKHYVHDCLLASCALAPISTTAHPVPVPTTPTTPDAVAPSQDQQEPVSEAELDIPEPERTPFRSVFANTIRRRRVTPLQLRLIQRWHRDAQQHQVQQQQQQPGTLVSTPVAPVLPPPPVASTPSVLATPYVLVSSTVPTITQSSQHQSSQQPHMTFVPPAPPRLVASASSQPPTPRLSQPYVQVPMIRPASFSQSTPTPAIASQSQLSSQFSLGGTPSQPAKKRRRTQGF